MSGIARTTSSAEFSAANGQIRMVGASWLPLPAAIAVAALQVSGAVGMLAGQVFSLAALEAAVAFGVASAVVPVYRRSNFGKAGQGSAATGERGTPPAT